LITSSPLLPPGIAVSGYVYEVETGKLKEIVGGTTTGG